jgi:MATE family multidrug resistance protein
MTPGRELRPMLVLAAPVVLAELGWVTMGIVDTLMVGRLGASAIGAVGLGSVLFFAVAVFAMGLLLGLDALVAHAFGAGRVDQCHRWLVDGVWLSGLAALPTVGVVLGIRASLSFWGLPPEVLRLAQPYLGILTWSLPPLLLYVAFRRYLQAMNIVRPVMLALLAANVVNAFANWILIYGHFGAPVMGVGGAAYATVAARVFMAAALVAVILRHEAHVVPRLRGTPLGLDPVRLRRLFNLGIPAAGQAVFEVGVFAAATALAGRVSANALAAHQIVLNMAAFTFMVPLGIASAAAVRVGQAMGRRDPRGAVTAGWTAIGIGVGFMAMAASIFLLAPYALMHAFTDDQSVIDIGVTLLFVAAVFQLFDGLQGVTTGALRGLADTRTAMMWNLAGHWLFGLPVGYLLCFHWGFGVVGLWWGLSAGLMICGIALLVVWMKRAPALLQSERGGRTWVT